MLTLAVLVLVVAGVRIAWGAAVSERGVSEEDWPAWATVRLGKHREASTLVAAPRSETCRTCDRDQLRTRAAIIGTFGRDKTAALSVAWCESRWKSHAIGGLNVGTFQLNYPAHHRPGESWAAFVRRFTVLRSNVAYAYRLSAGGRDWSAWTCRP